jgi:ferredoxin
MIEVNISKRCQAWGQCVFDAPEIFSLVDGERKTWEYLVDKSLKDRVVNAALHCPNDAISYRELND